MAETTAPIVLAGAITAVSDYMQGRGWQWRTVLATGLAAGSFALLEKVNAGLAVPLAWLAFVGSMIIPRANGTDGPAAAFLHAWNSSTPKTAHQMAT